MAPPNDIEEVEAVDENHKRFGGTFVTYKVLAINLVGFLMLIFTVGTWALSASGERLHPDAVNVREMVVLREQMGKDMDALKSSNNKIHELLTKILLKE